MKLENIVKGVKYLPLVVAGFLAQEGYGQYSWPRPPQEMKKINLFISPDSSERAIEYNSLKTRAQRDSIIRERLKEDWVNTMPYKLQ
ncbi:MAG: hypothetical protein NTV01_00320 [Bacteroidia bacterium]|nr:hypothetical protein [Bacteroidia bacterium]